VRASTSPVGLLDHRTATLNAEPVPTFDTLKWTASVVACASAVSRGFERSRACPTPPGRPCR
jgi:hypothetical protein